MSEDDTLVPEGAPAWHPEQVPAFAGFVYAVERQNITNSSYALKTLTTAAIFGILLIVGYAVLAGNRTLLLIAPFTLFIIFLCVICTMVFLSRPRWNFYLIIWLNWAKLAFTGAAIVVGLLLPYLTDQGSTCGFFISGRSLLTIVLVVISLQYLSTKWLPAVVAPGTVVIGETATASNRGQVQLPEIVEPAEATTQGDN